MKQYNAIDLFCGAGGLSKGFEWAGFNVVAGIDNNEEALVTYKNNFKKAQAIKADLSSNNDIEGVINKLENIKVDILLGGPPCQGFSIAGKRIVDDPRNKLFKAYLTLVENFNPSIILIENVPNILSLGNGLYKKTIIEDLGNLGYKVEILKLNAADFGVPQNRRRVFFVASKSNVTINDRISSKMTNNETTTEMAISDLPLLNDSLGDEGIDYATNPKSKYQSMLRGSVAKVYNHTAVAHTPKTKEIIALVPDGGNYKNLPVELQGTRKVNIAWTRMNSQKPCFTIDAGHNHHFHYKANRVPTVRECARIQSFPDDFIFCGKRTSQYKQVGNAVPPILAKELACCIKEVLNAL